MAAGAELLKRLFTSEIQPKLFPSSSFLSRSMKDDSYVSVNTVELAHSGTIPEVKVDRTILPAPIAKRTDVATSYTIEELTTDPTLIQDSEALIVAYGKRASILDQHIKSQRTKMANRALYKWAVGASSFKASTGTGRAAGGPSQTGNRRAFTVADILAVQQRFFADDIQTDLDDINGVAVLTPRQYSDLLAISQFTDADKYGSSAIPSGVVRRAFGFDIYVRSQVVVLDSSDALKAEGAAGAAGDQDAAIFYSPSYVRRAVGAIKTYIDDDKPEYYGSIFSTMVRFGAIAARNDNKGVYLLFEDTV
jgi:hypothetical protein